SVRKPVPSALIFSCVSGSGTRFTVTRIFTGGVSSGGIPDRNPVSLQRSPMTVKLSGDRGENRFELAGLALPDVEAEAAGQIAARLHDEGRELLVDALGLKAIGGADEGERADDGARVVADRDRDGTDVFHVLAHVDRVPARPDRLELLLQHLAID